MHECVKSQEEPGFLTDVMWKVIPQLSTICCAHLSRTASEELQPPFY